MRIGIAYDLKQDFVHEGPQPDDILEEYDSLETVEAIAGALRGLGHETINLGGGRLFLQRLLSQNPATKPDLIFNLAEGCGGRCREAHVPAVCEIVGVPCTHSDPLTLALTLDKQLTKRLLASYGVPTAPCCLIEHLGLVAGMALPPFPVIAKPNGEGSSMGIGRECVCLEPDTLFDRVRSLLRDYRQPVLIESFLPGVEVTVAVTGNGAGAQVIGAMEIAPRQGDTQDFVYGLEVKRNYLSEVDYHVPPRLTADTRAAIEETALRAYGALGCRDIARIDLRLDGAGQPCLIEINALPGLDPVRSDVPILCRKIGMSYKNLIGEIIRHSTERTGPNALGATPRARRIDPI